MPRSSTATAGCSIASAASEEALVELRRAFALQKDAEIAAHVGEVLWDLGKKDEARKYFEEARKLDPENRSLQRALQKTGESGSRRGRISDAVRPSLMAASDGLALAACGATVAAADASARAHAAGGNGTAGARAGPARRSRLVIAGTHRRVQPAPRAAAAASTGSSDGPRYKVALSAPVTRQSWRLSGDDAGRGWKESRAARARAAMPRNCCASDRLGHPGASRWPNWVRGVRAQALGPAAHRPMAKTAGLRASSRAAGRSITSGKPRARPASGRCRRALDTARRVSGGPRCAAMIIRPARAALPFHPNR